MATENNIEGFSPTDALGSDYGNLNLPDLSTSRMTPFNGDRIEMPETNFPKPNYFRPSIPAFDAINKDQVNVRQNIVGQPPSKPGGAKISAQDRILSMDSYIKGSLDANQDKNQYSRIYQYNSGPSGNAFYQRYAAYGQEKFDEVGFTPLRDNEAAFNAKTTGWNDFTRMIEYSFLPLVKHGFIAGPKSLGMALKGDFGADLEEARAYEDATAIGYSSKGGIGSFVNNTVMNFGYTAGIIAEVLAEEAVLGAFTLGSGGAGAPVAAVRTASNMSRIGKGFAQAFYLDRAANVVGKALTSLKNTEAARSFWKAANTPAGRFFNPLTNTFDAVSNVKKLSYFDNLTALAKVSKTAGGFYADVRRLNAAFSEGRLEGGLVQNHIFDKSYNEFWEKTGRAPSDEEQYDMMQTAKEGAMETIAWNTALVYLSNGITFNNIFTPKGGMRKLLAGKTAELMATAEGKVVAKAVKKEGSKLVKVKVDYIENSFKNSWKAFKAAPARTLGKAGATYFKANVTEGIQENLQESISEAMENYYTDAYRDDAVRSHLFAKAAMTKGMRDKFSYFSDAWGNQNPLTAQGFETFATGFAMGILGGGLNMVPGFVNYSYNKMFKTEEYQKYFDTKHKYGQDLAKTLQSQFSDPKFVFDSRLFDLAVQNQAGKLKRTGSRAEVLDANDHALVSSIVTAINTNSFDLFKEQIESYKDITDEEFEDVMKLEKGQAKKYRAKIDTVLARMDEIKADYKEQNERYPDPIDLSGYKKGTDAYKKAAIYASAWARSRDNAVFLGQTYKNAKQRMLDIEKLLRSKRPISKMTDSELMVMLDPSRMKSEIDILKTEIESGKDIFSKKEIEQRQRKIDALRELDKAINYYYRYDNAALESKITSLKDQGKFKDITDEEGNVMSEEEAESQTREIIRKRLNVREKNDQNTTKAEADLELSYKNYLKAIANINEDDYLDRNADEAFEYILDNYRLGRDAGILNNYVNLLHNPNEFLNHVNRNYEWMNRLYENRKSYYDSLVNQELNNIELNALLNALADKGVYISADDAYEFQRSGTIPAEFFDDARKIVIKPGSVEYDEYVEIFKRANLLKQIDPKSKTDINERVALELNQLYIEEEQEIDALPKVEQVTEKGDLDMGGNKTVKLADVVSQLADGDMLSAFYLSNGEPIEVKLYKDGDQIKYESEKGEVVDVANFAFDIVDGKIFSKKMVPADPIAAQKIRNEYSKKREEVIRRSIEDIKTEQNDSRKEFVPFTTQTPWSQLDKALQEELTNAFNKYVGANPTLLDEYSNYDTVKLQELLEDFVSENPIAKEIIDNYNQEMLSRMLEEDAVKIIPPVIEHNGESIDLAYVSFETAKEILADLEEQYKNLPKENLTNEQSEDLALAELNLELIRKYVADVEALETPAVEADTQGFAAENRRRRELAEQALKRRIELIEEKKRLLQIDEDNITDTLDYLQQLLDNTVELTGVQVEDIMNKIEQLDKTTAQMLKANNQKKKAGKIKERASVYRQQVRREFAVANDILTLINIYRAEINKILIPIKKDLTKQADYYRNLIADPNFSLFDKTDIKNKIDKIEKKISSIQRLINILRNAIAKSIAYIKEYLNIWKGQNAALSKLKAKTGYTELSREELNSLINATDDLSKKQLDEYPEFRRNMNELERQINRTMDDVELIEEVKAQESNRLLELEGAIQKYQDQVRYLYDLLDPVAQEIVENKVSNDGYTSPKPDTIRVEGEVADVVTNDEKVTILSQFSIADIADLENALTSAMVGGRKLTPQEEKLQGVRSIIKEVLKNAEFIKLSSDGKNYINTKTGKTYERVTSYTKEDDIKDQILPNESIADYSKRLITLGYTEKDINSKLRLASSQIIGIKIDDLIRDFFSGRYKSALNYDFAPKEEVEKLVKKLQGIKEALDNRKEVVLANNIVLYNDEIGVAGTVDLLTFDVNGDIRIYDIKTMLGNNFSTTYSGDNVVKYESKKFGKSKRQQHTEQLSLYRILLNNTHGLKARTIGVMPIALEYKPGDTASSSVDLLDGLILTPMDAVKNAVLIEKSTTQQNVQNAQPSGTQMNVGKKMNDDLRNQLNLMGYSNTAIDLLPKSEIEKIVKGGITKETYASRTMTGPLFNESGKIFAKVGDPVVISAIKEGGVVIQKVNVDGSIFITFEQLANITTMKDSPSQSVKEKVEVTPEVTSIIQDSSDLVKEVLDKEINNLDDMVKDKNIDDLKNSLFNTKIC